MSKGAPGPRQHLAGLANAARWWSGFCSHPSVKDVSRHAVQSPAGRRDPSEAFPVDGLAQGFSLSGVSTECSGCSVTLFTRSGWNLLVSKPLVSSGCLQAFSFALVGVCPASCGPAWQLCGLVFRRLQWDPCVDWQRALSRVPFPANQQPSASLSSDLCLLSSVRAPTLLGPFPASGAESASQVKGLVQPVGCLSGAQAGTSRCLMTGASWMVQWPLVDGGRPLGCTLVPPGQEGGFYPRLFIVFTFP